MKKSENFREIELADADILRIVRIGYARSDDVGRLALTGVYLAPDGEICATDGKILAISQLSVGGTEKPVILSTEAVSALRKMYVMRSGEYRRKAEFRGARVLIDSMRLEIRPLDWDQPEPVWENIPFWFGHHDATYPDYLEALPRDPGKLAVRYQAFDPAIVGLALSIAETPYFVPVCEKVGKPVYIAGPDTLVLVMPMVLESGDHGGTIDRVRKAVAVVNTRAVLADGNRGVAV